MKINTYDTMKHVFHTKKLTSLDFLILFLFPRQYFLSFFYTYYVKEPSTAWLKSWWWAHFFVHTTYFIEVELLGIMLIPKVDKNIHYSYENKISVGLMSFTHFCWVFTWSMKKRESRCEVWQTSTKLTIQSTIHSICPLHRSWMIPPKIPVEM